MTIRTHVSVHGPSTINARSDNGVVGALRLEFCTAEWSEGYYEIVAYLEDQILADRLAVSINEIVKARKAELQVEQVEAA